MTSNPQETSTLLILVRNVDGEPVMVKMGVQNMHARDRIRTPEACSRPTPSVVSTFVIAVCEYVGGRADFSKFCARRAQTAFDFYLCEYCTFLRNSS